MINRKELRQGSIIQRPFVFGVVEEIYEKRVLIKYHTGKQVIEEYQFCGPVALTPWALENCGFDCDESQNDFTLKGVLTLKNVGDYQTWNCDQLYKFDIQFKWLHQLQNVIQFLTGQELEVNKKFFTVYENIPNMSTQ